MYNDRVQGSFTKLSLSLEGIAKFLSFIYSRNLFAKLTDRSYKSINNVALVFRCETLMYKGLCVN